MYLHVSHVSLGPHRMAKMLAERAYTDHSSIFENSPVYKLNFVTADFVSFDRFFSCFTLISTSKVLSQLFFNGFRSYEVKIQILCFNCMVSTIQRTDRLCLNCLDTLTILQILPDQVFCWPSFTYSFSVVKKQL